MKGSDAIYVTTMMRLKKEGYKPDRDIILALTADEEGGKSNGVDWLLKNHRDLVDAEFVAQRRRRRRRNGKGKPFVVAMGASEKLYADYELEVTNPGGHSSLPDSGECYLPAGGRTGAPAELQVPVRAE